MRRLALILSAILLGCEEKPSAKVDETADPAASAVASAKPKPAWDAASMPQRPVPKGTATVSYTMPQDVQMLANGYMNAMATPHPDDALIDAPFVAQLQVQLKAAAEALDKGSKAERSKLAVLVQTTGAGRRIDVLMVAGCDADMPKRLALKAGYTLETLLIHGVLVVRCNDRSAQCFQSTRDSDDVLCTTAPRHQ